MKKRTRIIISTSILVIFAVKIVRFYIPSSRLHLSLQEPIHGNDAINVDNVETESYAGMLFETVDGNSYTENSDLIGRIQKRVEQIKENEDGVEKYISDSIVMFEVWFDDSTIVYFNRGYRGLGLQDLNFYYDIHGKLVFISLDGIEHNSNGEIIHKRFSLYFNDDSLIRLDDISDTHFEMGASEIHDWIISNVDVLIDSAYNEWKVLIQEETGRAIP